MRAHVFPQVLSVDPENKKLYLTRKKALIESSLPLFLSYADARRGRVSHGYIVCVKEFGCIVRFYNSVKGLVPLDELSDEPIVSPQEVFYVGQVRRSTWRGHGGSCLFLMICRLEVFCRASLIKMFVLVGRPGAEGQGY